MNKNDIIKGYQKKANLIQQYYEKIEKLEQKRSAVNREIKLFKGKFKELILSDPDPDQLVLFENMDVFLKENLD